ncbi:MAG TPA: hypothetical protein VM261_22355 [Kofleriaceae bacterium]|nr:hypothetical protein [Kofleriaceae bacterium]
MKLALALLMTWVATRGVMEPGRAPGSFWIATEAVPGRFSNGEVMSTGEVELPYRIDVRWRRIGPEGGRSMHVTVSGAVVLFQTGRLAVYAFDEAAFAANGWTPVPELRTHDEQTVSVEQDAREVRIFVEGELVLRHPVVVTKAKTKVGVGMKGAKGFRSSIYVRSVTVRRELGTAPEVVDQRAGVSDRR